MARFGNISFKRYIVDTIRERYNNGKAIQEFFVLIVMFMGYFTIKFIQSKLISRVIRFCGVVACLLALFPRS